MTELIPLARPYAQAAFEYAIAQQEIAGWTTLLTALAQRMAYPLVQQLLKDPRYTTHELAEIVIALAETVVDKAGENFIALLAEKQRLILLPQIAQLFAEYVATYEQRITVDVTSAIPLSETQQKTLQQVLAKRLGLDVTLNCAVQPDLLGGLRLRIKDQVIDHSIRGQFARLKTQLLG
jgi:F-type H+-transporting ATPase subunit delta